MKLFRKIFFTVLIFTVNYSVNAQGAVGTIAGKVFNDKNEPLSGVSITIVGTQFGTVSNMDGTFSLTTTIGLKSLQFEAINFESKIISEILVEQKKVSQLDVLMEFKVKELNSIVIKSNSSKKETTNALIAYQKNTNTVAQVVSAEAIKRSPDRNIGEVLKRVPGTSVQEGKYLVVRGLSDRYNQTMVNGVLMSSTEPDRKTFSYDIFPSSLVDNLIINKAFIPELPGEWAGGLVQINTKEIPAKGFFTLQLGTGFNTQTINQSFYTYKGGKLDWLGFDDGSRKLSNEIPSKFSFSQLSNAEKTKFAKYFNSEWSSSSSNSTIIPAINQSFQVSGGFNKNIGKTKLGSIMALTYNRSIKKLNFDNAIYNIQNGISDVSFQYQNEKFIEEVLIGTIANFNLQINNYNKISFKNTFSVNSTDFVTNRVGKDFENDPILGENIKASELGFRQNTFFNSLIQGEHLLKNKNLKLNWYGNFNILDQYVPGQKRIQYNQNAAIANAPYLLLVSASKTSQKSGSIYYGNLNDYIYTAGGDISKSYMKNGLNQTVKLGYMFQQKERLFNSRPFSIYIPTGANTTLQSLPANQIFNYENFGNGDDNKFAFNEIFGNQYRYIASTILNATYVQFDNQISKKLRATWGVRWENFDQIIGSKDDKDPRYVRSLKSDFLPGLNLTYKLNSLTNIRFSASQTIIRPEFRELSPFAFFDFEMGSTVTGNKNLVRTKVTNIDLRYESYPRLGELFTLGVFYKHFKNPIELYFNQTGAGSSSTFNYINADQANAFGIELDYRKKLDFINALKNFTFQTNLSYIYNRVSSANTGLERPMQGQSPYLINAGLQYDEEKLGYSATLMFNQIGRRILYVGNADFPPVWENSRPLIDIQIAKKLWNSKGEVKLNISDLLNRIAYFYHDTNDNKKFDKESDAIAVKRKYGSNISLSLNYTIK